MSENISSHVYVDKWGDEIDLSVIYGVYKTQQGMTGFFKRCTKYSDAEINDAVQYIMKNVNAKPYDQENAKRMMKQIEGQVPESEAKVKCPVCGSDDLQIISDVQGKGASFWKLCFCGLLGLCGTGKTTTTHYWVCKSCGNKFKV